MLAQLCSVAGVLGLRMKDSALHASHAEYLADLELTRCALLPAGLDTAGSGLSGLANGLQNRGSMTLDGLQSRNSVTVEGLASQHASHQNMLNTVAAAQIASAVSKNGSISAMNELSEAQEAQLQNAVAEARSSGE